MEKLSFKELADRVVKLKSKHRQKLIGIDGGGGAGKSTFGAELQKYLPGSVLIHGDDFYKGPWNKRLDHTDYVTNPLFNWERFSSEVLESVRKGEPVRYHIYDWHKHSTDEVVSVPEEAIIIVEGGGTTQKDFSDTYDYRIWIEADEETRLKKALLRDGEHMRFLWEEDWLPVERNYIEKDNPASRADLVVIGHGGEFTAGAFRTIV